MALTSQTHIDRIVASSGPSGHPTMRPRKEWCDKWIHDGKCAFTQQGCKFKHEMPSDPETLERLGLFSGPPVWYIRKLDADARRMGLAARSTDWRSAREGGGGGGGGGGSLHGRPAYQHRTPLMNVTRPAISSWRYQVAAGATAPDNDKVSTATTTAGGEQQQKKVLTDGSVPQTQRSPCPWGPIAPPSRRT
jgi:hypothetical protein